MTIFRTPVFVCLTVLHLNMRSPRFSEASECGFTEAYDAGNYPWGVSSGGHYGSDGGSDGDNWWAYTSPVGGNGAHENHPPFYAVLYYIRAK